MNDALILQLVSEGVLRVDAEAGLVYSPRSNWPLKPCGSKTSKGYLRVCITHLGRQHHFMAHRIVWVSVNGLIPQGKQIDHVNTVKSDNRLVNLEAVTGHENMHRGALNGCFCAAGMEYATARADSVRSAPTAYSMGASGTRYRAVYAGEHDGPRTGSDSGGGR